MADFIPTPANVVTSAAATIVEGTAAAAINAGQLVYKNALGLWDLADADGISPLYKVAGMAIDSAPGANQPIAVVTDDPDLIVGGSTPIGTTMIVSATAGAMCPDVDGATGMYKSVVGIITAPGHMRFRVIRSDVAMP